MTTGRSGKDDNLWGDLAAKVVQQVSDRIRSAAEHPRPPRDSRAADAWDRDEGSTWADGGKSRPAPASRPASASRPGPAERPRPSATSALGGELKRLMADGLRATVDSISEYQADKERRAAERERKRLEAPMRKAKTRSMANKVGAYSMGFLALGGIGATTNLIATDQAPSAAPAGVMTVGFGAGAYALGRRSKKYSEIADEEARRLGASSATAVMIKGASAYSVPLPPKSSMAYDPTRRLMEQKQALAMLLPDIEQVAPELGPLARESEDTLAQYAERIIKLERAQAAANGASSLDSALARAVAQYEDGVSAHQKLVEAAATVMAEMSGDGIFDPAHHSMDAAADRLQGLAEGLRQVRNDIPLTEPNISSPPDPARADAPRPDAAHSDAPRPAPRPGAPRAGGRKNRHQGLAD